MRPDPLNPPATAPAAASSTAPASLLADLATDLASGGDLGDLLERFLDPVIRLAGAQAGAVRLMSDTGQRLEVVTSLGLPDRVAERGSLSHRHCGLCGHAADRQDLMWANDLRACCERSGNRYFGEGCRCLLAVPLRHRGRTLGIYNLFFEEDRPPAPEILQILRTVGDLLGLALNNARLEQAQLRATLLQERQAMAAEVHDSLAQGIAFVKMRMPLLRDALEQGDRDRALQYADDVRNAASQAHASLRGIITHLRAPMDPQGLMHALRGRVDQFRRECDTALDFVCDRQPPALNADQEAHVFHIVQEALTNVARHAHARQAWLRLGTEGASRLLVLVEDDGKGLAPADVAGHQGHYGLEIMHERARRLGGLLDVRPRPGGGTQVQLTIPLGTGHATVH